jgi:hypothetical protein
MSYKFELVWLIFASKNQTLQFIFHLFSGLNNVMGLAVDWIGNNLFWTDEGLRAIFVTSLSDSTKVAR